MGEDFLSLRSWIIFFGTEAILAGVLWVIGILSPFLLILFGLLLLCGLWAYERGIRLGNWNLRLEKQPEWLSLIDARNLAAAIGWDMDPRSTAGHNDCFEFTQRLRQAAVRGLVPFEGRKFKGIDWPEHSKGKEPLVSIPAEHFEEFELNPLEVLGNNNYQIFTGKIAVDRHRLHGQIYRDLHVKASEFKKWLKNDSRAPSLRHGDAAPTKPAIDAKDILHRNMNMTDAFKVLNETSEYPDFEDALYQALFDGRVLAWGRQQIGWHAEDGFSPYQIIDRDYWRTGRFEWTTIGLGGTERATRADTFDFTRIQFNADQIRQLAQNIADQKSV